MASTGTILARYMAIYIDDVTIDCQVDAELSLSKNMFQTTCKDSAAWDENRPGTKSWTMSGSGNLAFDATNGWRDLYDAFVNDTLVTTSIQTATAGDYSYSGSAYFSSLSMTSSGNDEAVTFDFELTGTGSLDEALVS